MDDWDDNTFIESIKSELCSLWKNKHIRKGSEVTSAARILVPAGFLQPIYPKLGPSPAVEQNEVVAPRRRCQLLLEVDDSSDNDGGGNYSPPCRDFFINYPKKRRSKKNALASISAWKNTRIALWTEGSSKDRRSCDHCLCCGDSLQLIESKRPKIAEISGHALRKVRESDDANRVANGPTHNLGLTLEGIVDSNKERTHRKFGFGAKLNKKNLESAERTCYRIRHEAGSTKENQESAERIGERIELGNSDSENQESAEWRTCERIEVGENSVKQNLESFERESYKLLEMKLKEAEQDNMVLVNMIEEQRRNSEQEKDGLRKELEDASYTIGELVRKIRVLEGMRLGVTF